MLHVLLWVLLLPTLLDLKYQGNDSEELHFPKLVVITPKTHSLHFTKQVLPSIWDKILMKIFFFGIIFLLSFTDLNPS